MRIAIIQFPGSNCERETMLAVKRIGMEPVEFLWNQAPQSLSQFDGYIIVGGFSYEDRSRSGIIAALDPIMNIVRQESEKAKPVLGICNGAQILVESGLVPGLNNKQVGMALTDNKRVQHGKILGTGYYNAWVYMRLADHCQPGAFTRKLTPQQPLHLPIAHGEGRFVMPPMLLTEIQARGLAVFQYCDATGRIADEFPTNPNGSLANIAAISNKEGNILAMMPHPERTAKGDAIFASMRDYIAGAEAIQAAPLAYVPPSEKISPYHVNKNAHELIVELIITDNQAMSVKQAFSQAGIPVDIKRQTHWELLCDSAATYDQILKTCVLYNDRKEYLVKPAADNTTATTFLVRPKEDLLGQQKKQLLEHHFGIQGIHTLHHGVLWKIAPQSTTKSSIDIILQTRLLFNGCSHDCYTYQ